MPVVQTDAAERAIVRTAKGLLRGQRVGDAHVFRGIPYASPPVGERRWRPPRPVESWPGVRSAEAFGPACPQPAAFSFMIPDDQPPSEDCLTLNLSAPLGASGLPVLVMIHGGGFASGSGEYLLMAAPLLNDEDVLLVTFNYRLSALGFFAHPELDGTHGVNYGLMDMIAALKWVNANIAAFGGDPARVTITGVSAGGMSVDSLMVTPETSGLFFGAIAQSGYGTWPRQPRTAGVDPIVGAPSAEAMGLALAGRAAGMPAEDVTRKDLYALTPGQLVEAESGFHIPIVDGISLPEESGTLFALGRQHAVPYISGGTSYDGSILPISGTTEEDVLAMTAGRADRMRALWAADFDVSRELGISRFFGDLRYVYAGWNMTRSMRRVGRPAFLYMFDYVPQEQRNSVPGATHGSDFDTMWGQPDLPIAETMRNYWINFVKTGDPNGEGLVPWPTSIGSDSRRWLVFSDGVEQKDDLRASRMEFIDALWEERVGAMIGDETWSRP
ncbi:MAG: carboxylesterase/lipase family protein [Myxococcota bacterium]